MISPKFFIDELDRYGIDYFAGVPDSLLKSICGYIADNMDARHNIITANEGAAVALAAGYHLATGKVGVVYMQNSGEGNAINPLASLVDKEVYNIPILLLIGWRGCPGVQDEPQHVKQGKVTTGLLNIMGVNYDVLSKEENKAAKQILKAVEAVKRNEVYALIIEKDTFNAYTLQNVERNNFTMSREEAIQTVVAALGEADTIISTTGMISRELFEYRTAMNQGHERDFLTVGAMGHASQIALGIALEKQDRKVWCFDGDGASIMHMGSMAIVANKAPQNYVHVVFNNGAHDSVGGQPTVGLKIDIPAIAKAMGYKHVYNVDTKEGLQELIGEIKVQEGPIFLQACVKQGNRKDLGRPTTTPIQNKEALMTFLRS
ncbi:phosphonopyruvate decarboxylase [Bacteroides xylanisolvens]|jgi:phosphonopyruvate decarboxylase|uniref:Phosphonopyruvate decarboxylase n=1 Tax=Bacteroides xylanisolvens TaxID=371601 RepID=A0A1Y4V8X4_9BACE|nr:phosphonopyruvate decarboxylase [Bacteroides xylanisolvens]KAA9050618.1 phosphonopyruvate decarboxylase [Bacteroides xylanisolvens]MBV3841676.1 phosphonopyruvate decarboxylase [Bacteroides xylanisolvens]MDB0715568.1 phosphonopyruvate decarboxylase [Bacteroides xylanisolvens]MDB0739326.1 phosphonopyruvate decarboxylase [Bacteroides xylanisolvens]OUQ66551.1 phosphonopyruvate decarboxylase [Bacteroides xylanisolvens]